MKYFVIKNFNIRTDESVVCWYFETTAFDKMENFLG